MVLRQSLRTFVGRVDFITSVGFADGPGAGSSSASRGSGPQRVITDLGVLQPDPATAELRLSGIYPGRLADLILKKKPAGTCKSAADLAEIAPPNAAELAVCAAWSPRCRPPRRPGGRGPRRRLLSGQANAGALR